MSTLGWIGIGVAVFAIFVSPFAWSLMAIGARVDEKRGLK